MQEPEKQKVKPHSPWSKAWEYFPPRSRKEASDCDAVTCSECPGGERCCNHLLRVR